MSITKTREVFSLPNVHYAGYSYVTLHFVYMLLCLTYLVTLSFLLCYSVLLTLSINYDVSVYNV